MARLRYVAFMAADPDRLAWFYTAYLGMTELGRSADGDVSLTDGFYNLTFFRLRERLNEPRKAPGLHHLGIEVESIEEIRDRYAEKMPNWQSVEEPGGLQYGEYRIYDPEGLPVSLSETGFGVPDGEDRVPRIAHIALNSVNTEAMLDFYTGVFDFRMLRITDIRRQEGRLNRFLGDGHTNLAVHPFHSGRPGHEPRYGVNHVGYLIADLEGALASLSKIIELDARPDDRPYAEYRLRDPEGNAFDLSRTKGWEVDNDVWMNALA